MSALRRFYRKHPKLTVYGGIGAAAALAGGLVYAVTHGGKKTTSGSSTFSPGLVPSSSMAVATAAIRNSNPNNQFVSKNQRVIAWPKNSDKNGLAFVKFVDNGHVRGGWIDESSIVRDADIMQTAQAPMSSALAGLGAGVQIQQPPVAPPPEPNATVTQDGLMFTKPEDQAKLAQLQQQLFHLVKIIGDGTAVIIPDEDTFRKIYTHLGEKVLGLIPSIFYSNGKFTKDTLKDHSWCKTWAAQVQGFGLDWQWPFYNQSVYRYPSSNPNYAGVPIDPLKDPAAYNDAVNASMNGAVQTAMQNASFDYILSQIEQITGTPVFTMLFGKFKGSGFILEITKDTRDQLAKFGFDLAMDPDSTKNMTPDQKSKLLSMVNGTVDGQQVTGDALQTIRAAIGTFFVSGMIDMFESHDPKVNPCIQELNFDLVLGMFLTVVSVFLTVVSLGSAGFFGAAIQAVYFTFYSAPKAITDLAALSK